MKTLKSAFYALLALTLPLAARAEEAASIQKIQFLGAGVTIPDIVANLIKAMLGFAGTVALAFFVYGGFTIMTAQGSEEKVKKGKEMLTNATLGLAAMFFSYTLLQFILTAFGKATAGA